MKYNWMQLFADFSQGLLELLGNMNEELNAYIDAVDCDATYDKTIAQIRQLDGDINRIVNFIDTFYEEKGLKKLMDK